MIDARPNVTRLAGWELSRLVIGSARRPCAAPGADPEAWFPSDPAQDPRSDPAGEKYLAAQYALEARARALCRGCPVELYCLERAIHLEGPLRGDGIAGGTTPRQRQAIKASRGMAVTR
jgi:Transcription factor WhiB